MIPSFSRGRRDPRLVCVLNDEMDAHPDYPSSSSAASWGNSCTPALTIATSLEADDSSLSSLHTTPSPPSSPIRPSVSPLTACGSPYPSPPSSQDSSRATPCPDRSSSGFTSGTEDSDARPAKRRRVGSRMPRDTERLDLDGLQDPRQQTELDRLVKAIRHKRKIVVVAGAGISVSAGIPDFRSSTGLFNSLKAQHNLKGSGKHLFDAAVYRDSDSTTSFHEMVRSLSNLAKTAKATPFHHLVASLAQEGRLLRLYSQNVDGIDTSLKPLATEVPLPRKGPWPKTVQLHGGLSHMTCQKCLKLYEFDADRFDGPIPPACEHCQQTDYARTEVAGKRSHGIGKLRPRMVLYNEHNPDDEAIGACVKSDLRRRPDCVIVVGTSLKIPGLRRIVREMCGVVRDHRDGLSVWINNDPEPSSREFDNCWDMIVRGTSDEVARHAGLQRWDETDMKVMTANEVAEVEARGQPKVIVDSPSKPNKFKQIGRLPTPLDSPKLQPRSYKDQQQPLTNPASRGKALKTVIKTGGSGTGTGTGVLQQRKPPSKITKAKVTGNRKNTKKQAVTTSTISNASSRNMTNAQSGQLNFKIEKSTIKIKSKHDDVNIDLNVTPKKLEPLKYSPTRENILPRYSGIGPPKWMK